MNWTSFWKIYGTKCKKIISNSEYTFWRSHVLFVLRVRMSQIEEKAKVVRERNKKKLQEHLEQKKNEKVREFDEMEVLFGDGFMRK